MPTIWTHCLFGQALAEGVGFAGKLEDTKRLNLYHTGCQGPDILFFHRFLPWNRKTMSKLGNAMHVRECGPTLMMMADRARDAGADSPLFLYVLGFMTHNVLDRAMHPYIFYRGGYRPWDHQRFETAMDTLIVRRMRGIETWRHPAWKLIDTGSGLPPEIAEMMAQTAQSLYPELAAPYGGRDWQRAYRDMVRGHKLFHDPYGIKRVLTFGKTSPMVYKRRPPVRDFLNEARREWRHPSIQEEKSNASVMDMWHMAMEDGNKMLHAMFDYASANDENAGRIRENLSEIIGNRSYETGKSCEPPLALNYSDRIFG